MTAALDTAAARLGRVGVTFAGLGLTILLGILDHVSGPELLFSVFYVAPLALVAWYAGLFPAVAMCGITACTWLIADISAGQVYSNLAVPVWNASVRLTFFLIIAHLLMALRESMRREAFLADTDSLTGLANNRKFYEVLSLELARANRFGTPFTLAYLDADNFKTVNDRMGHAEGDRVLREIAERLTRETRATDVPARLGGDEFAVLFSQCDEALARQLLPKVRERLLAAMAEHGWPVTFSIGVVSFGPGVTKAEHAVHMADELMYAVKSAGKDEILYHTLGTAPAPFPGAPHNGNPRR